MPRRLFNGLILFGALSAPKQVLACAVCFGGAGGDIARAYTWGIVILLGFTAAILAALVYAIARIEARRSQEDAREAREERGAAVGA